MPNRRAHRMRVSATDVRDDVSTASVRTSRSGLPQKQRDRSDRTVRSDADARHDAIARPVEIRDRRHHAQIDLAGVEQPRALRRRDRTAACTRSGTRVEAVDERPDVEVVDGAEPDRPLHACTPDCLVAYRPSRSTGAAKAARIWRSISSRGDRRGPRSAGSIGGDAVDVVGAVGDRHLRELGTVERPVHLDERDRAAHQPRHRNRPHIVVAGRRRCRRDRGAAAAQTP